MKMVAAERGYIDGVMPSDAPLALAILRGKKVEGGQDGSTTVLRCSEMKSDFAVYDPKKFFEVFVVRAFEEYLTAPLDHLRVKTVVSNADILAERVWDSLKGSDPSKIGNAKSARDYRIHLVENECPDFQIVWDIHDGHKHVHLTRGNRQVSSAAQSGVKDSGGPLGSMPLGGAPLGGATDEFIVRLDDGTERNLTDVLGNVMGMWELVLSRL